MGLCQCCSWNELAPHPVPQRGFVVVLVALRSTRVSQGQASGELWPSCSYMLPTVLLSGSIHLNTDAAAEAMNRKPLTSEPQAKEQSMICKGGQIPTSPKGKTSISCFPSKLKVGKEKLRWRDRESQKKKCPSRSTGSPSELVKAQQSSHPGREGEEKIMGSHSSGIIAANVYWSMTVCQSLFCVLTVINPYNMPGKEAR